MRILQGMKESYILVLLTTLLLSSCGGGKNEFVSPPPAEVTVQLPEQRDVTTYMEFPGRTSPYRTVEIRARVKGFLQKRAFEQGEAVEKGDLLFNIEPESFIAAVESAEGDLASAKAAFEIATTDRAMKVKAGKTNAISKLDVEKSRANEKAAEAAVKVAQAALDNAKIDLSYTKITAPEPGRTSRALVDIGNLVGSGDSTLLTTIINDSIIYAYFEVNERVILPYLGKREKTGDAEKEKVKNHGRVRLRMGNGEEYSEDGVIDFIDNTVDKNTGTIQLRGKFDNAEATLVSGLFVRVMIPQEVKGAILVPRHAIQRDMQGDFVLVVNKENVVERRNVTATSVVGETKIIEKGLQADERVIVQGLQRAREGIKVSPKEAEKEAGKAAGEPVGEKAAKKTGEKAKADSAKAAEVTEKPKTNEPSKAPVADKKGQ
ncbi:MAG: efflux RND transporter periplasmic adaptor subunit [Verrucomicrobiales bacterium]|nr:efflux RND transporter periplasmic adaptor subunit [Verrucomicrobiales bacterium]